MADTLGLAGGLSANFFEWGIRCEDLETNSIQVPGASAVSSVSFNWNTMKPAMITSGTTGITYGVGQCRFEMHDPDIKCNIQDAFSMQKVIAQVEIIRFINDKGISLESEKYVFQNVKICSYQFESKLDQSSQRHVIDINSSGEYKYIQIIRQDGKIVGQRVTRSYNVQSGVI